jgi:hypothetical protein
MTLNRAVFDLMRQFWEHGQLYVALSRVRHPGNLCILLPESSEEISTRDPTAVPLRIDVDREVVNVVSTIAGHPIGEVRTFLSVPSTQPITREFPIDDFTTRPGEQADHETDQASQSPSDCLELIWSENETDDEYESCMHPMTELDCPVLIDDTTGGELTRHEIASDLSIELDAPLQRNEDIDSDGQANNISDPVNLIIFEPERSFLLVRSSPPPCGETIQTTALCQAFTEFMCRWPGS